MGKGYYVGLDMGTGSVGWAVTDESYQILRRHGKAMWGAFTLLGKETIDFYNTSDTRGTSQFYGLNYQKTGFLQRMTKDIHTKKCLQIFGEK